MAIITIITVVTVVVLVTSVVLLFIFGIIMGNNRCGQCCYY